MIELLEKLLIKDNEEEFDDLFQPASDEEAAERIEKIYDEYASKIYDRIHRLYNEFTQEMWETLEQEFPEPAHNLRHSEKFEAELIEQFGPRIAADVISGMEYGRE
jgi:hypothetical protein